MLNVFKQFSSKRLSSFTKVSINMSKSVPCVLKILLSELLFGLEGAFM